MLSPSRATAVTSPFATHVRSGVKLVGAHAAPAAMRAVNPAEATTATRMSRAYIRDGLFNNPNHSCLHGIRRNAGERGAFDEWAQLAWAEPFVRSLRDPSLSASRVRTGLCAERSAPDFVTALDLVAQAGP